LHGSKLGVLLIMVAKEKKEKSQNK
jgi:hypothetical protein